MAKSKKDNDNESVDIIECDNEENSEEGGEITWEKIKKLVKEMQPVVQIQPPEKEEDSIEETQEVENKVEIQVKEKTPPPQQMSFIKRLRRMIM